MEAGHSYTWYTGEETESQSGQGWPQSQHVRGRIGTKRQFRSYEAG